MLSRTLPIFSPIGVIGLGKMGENIAKNLVLAGHDTVMFDIDSSNVERVAGENPGKMFAAGSVMEVAERCDRVITMLPNDKILNSVCGER